MNQPKLTGLVPLPPEFLFPGKDDASKAALAKYAALPPDQRLLNGGKWWSMFDLMKQFYGGIMPEHGETNFIQYAIDLTNPDVKYNEIADPMLVAEINMSMIPTFQQVNTDINAIIGEMKTKAAADALKVVTDANTSNRKSGGKKKGGAPDAAAAAAAPAAPAPAAPAAPAPAAPAPAAPAPPAKTIESILSADNLKQICLADVAKITLNSLNRIYVTNTKPGALPLSTGRVAPVLAGVLDQAVAAEKLAENIAAQQPLIGGRRRRNKTRKDRGKKKGKKTRRRRN